MNSGRFCFCKQAGVPAWIPAAGRGGLYTQRFWSRNSSVMMMCVDSVDVGRARSSSYAQERTDKTSQAACISSSPYTLPAKIFARYRPMVHLSVEECNSAFTSWSCPMAVMLLCSYVVFKGEKKRKRPHAPLVGQPGRPGYRRQRIDDVSVLRWMAMMVSGISRSCIISLQNYLVLSACTATCAT